MKKEVKEEEAQQKDEIEVKKGRRSWSYDESISDGNPNRLKSTRGGSCERGGGKFTFGRLRRNSESHSLMEYGGWYNSTSHMSGINTYIFDLASFLLAELAIQFALRHHSWKFLWNTYMSILNTFIMESITPFILPSINDKNRPMPFPGHIGCWV